MRGPSDAVYAQDVHPVCAAAAAELPSLRERDLAGRGVPYCNSLSLSLGMRARRSVGIFCMWHVRLLHQIDKKVGEIVCSSSFSLFSSVWVPSGSRRSSDGACMAVDLWGSSACGPISVVAATAELPSPWERDLAGEAEAIGPNLGFSVFLYMWCLLLSVCVFLRGSGVYGLVIPPSDTCREV